MAAQEPPKVGCPFDGYDGKLAEVTTKSAGLDRGDMVVIYRSEGDWTCAYLTGKNGSSPGWILTKTIRPIASDPNPPRTAWLGTWGFEENVIKIGRADTPGKLALSGKAIWHGNGGVAHYGSISGEATLKGNQLHFVEGEDPVYSCVVDSILFTNYLLVNDNGRCGGMNVRFSGIWKRANGK